MGNHACISNYLRLLYKHCVYMYMHIYSKNIANIVRSLHINGQLKDSISVPGQSQHGYICKCVGVREREQKRENDRKRERSYF